MTNRKKRVIPEEDDSAVKKKRKQLNTNAPEIKNLSDLVKLSKEKLKYNNINMPILNGISDDLVRLEEMVGMKQFKETIFLQILYFLQGLHNNEDYLHAVIYGQAGCGKTEVSKILGAIYAGLGLLSKGTFRSVKRADLVSRYLGETSIKTKKILEENLGGVLFIDEAYSLGHDRESGSPDSYSKECIDCINQFLSENKNDFAMIIAGYESDIETCFFGQNQGLKRRFPWVHTIDKYSDMDLVDILKLKVKKCQWSLGCSDDFLVNLIKEHKNCFKYYGGSIEILITKAKMCHARRVFGKDKSLLFVFTDDDFIQAIKMVEPAKDSSTYESMFM